MLSKPLKLCISIVKESIDCLLAQDVVDDFEKVIYYLSFLLNDAKIRYIPIEKLCLCLYYAFTKLEYYMLPKMVLVICKIDIVTYLFDRPVLQGRLMRWAIKFHSFALNYVLRRVIKG